MDQDTSVATKLSKLFSLPDSVMDREPQHAEKVGAWSSTYDLCEVRLIKILSLCLVGPKNPLSIANIIVMCLNENSRHIVATNTPKYKTQT